MRRNVKEKNWKTIKQDSCEGCHFAKLQYDWLNEEYIVKCSLPDDFPDCNNKVIFVKRED